LVDPKKWIFIMFGKSESGYDKYPTIFMILCKSFQTSN
jgi:hypothetical protein